MSIARILESAKWLYGVTIIATLLLFLRQSQLQTIINNDGVTYIQGAAGFLAHGWSGVIALKAQAAWPFYSIYIGLVAKLTSLSVLHAATLLTGALIIGCVCVFVFLVGEMGGDKRTQWFALLAMLAWHGFVKYWPDYFRDQGFDCFFLLSVCFFLRFLREYEWRYALLWSLASIMAFSFRLEAVVYVLLIPLAVFCKPGMKLSASCYACFKLYLLPLILAGVMAAVCVYVGHHLQNLRLGYLYQQLSGVFGLVKVHFVTRAHMMGRHIFPEASEYASWALVGALLLVFLAFVFNTVGVLNLLAIAYLRWGGVGRLQGDRLFFWAAYFVVTLLIVSLFFLEYFFLSGRYLLALGLLVLLLVPFALQHAQQQWQARKKLWSKGGIWLIFFIGIVYNLIASSFQFGHESAGLEVMAGEWTKQHIPAQATIYSNTKRVLYYAAAPPSYQRGEMAEFPRLGRTPKWYLKQHRWQCFDYLIYRGNVIQFMPTYNKLRQQGRVQKIVKQFGKHNSHGIVVIRVNKLAC